MSSATWDGFTYFTNDQSFLDHIRRGKSEPYSGQLSVVTRYVTAYPSRNRTMIDVGAHIGSTMLPYSRLFKNVYGFEPNRDTFKLCLQNIQYNNVTNCKVENCAIMDRIVTGKSVSHNTCNDGCIYFKEDPSGNVGSKILDEDPTLSEVDYIKIDTEGAEILVIKSALTLIKTWKPLIQAEINGLSERNFNIPSSDLSSLLHDLGYVRIPTTDFFMHSDYYLF